MNTQKEAWAGGGSVVISQSGSKQFDPGFCSSHASVSLSKTLNLKFLLVMCETI